MDVTASTNSSQEVQKTFRSPKKLAVKRKAVSAPTPVMEEALSLMRSVQSKGQEKDEFALFGEQVALKLRKIDSPYARFSVQNVINKALFEGEMGYFNYPSAHSYESPVASSSPSPVYQYSTHSTTPTPQPSPQDTMDNLLSI